MKIIKRNLYKDLIQWSKTKNKKSLLLLGATQVGKTHLIKSLANDLYNDKHIYINLKEDIEIKKNINNIISIKEILEIISTHYSQKIEKGWLIIFDEIQELPNATTILNLFSDNDQYHVVGLSVCLTNESETPLDEKINIMNLYPINFQEYVSAKYEHDSGLIGYLDTDKQIDFDQNNHENLIIDLKKYLIVGGMPEVTYSYLLNNDLMLCNQIKKNIHFSYMNNVSKLLLDRNEKIKPSLIYQNLITFLSRENKSFILSSIEKKSKYKDYENTLISLTKSNFIIKINNIKSHESTSTENKKETNFKLYFNDVGFISLLTKINMENLFSNENLIGQNVQILSAIGQNYVIQQLIPKINIDFLSYYIFTHNVNKYSIDLMLNDTNDNIIPCEIKLSKKFTTKSLNLYIKLHKPKYALIFSLNKFNARKIGATTVIDIPIYMISYLVFVNNKISIDTLLKNNN